MLLSNDGSNFRFPDAWTSDGQLIDNSTAGGKQPAWSHDGREVFYRADDKMMAVSFGGDPTTTGAPMDASWPSVPETLVAAIRFESSSTGCPR